MLYENIKTIADSNGLSINELESEKYLNIAKGSICKWNDVSPSYDKIVKLAKFLNTTVEKIVGDDYERDKKGE